MEGAKIFEARGRLLAELGWAENPFVKDLRIHDKGSFLKYYCPLDGGKILERLAFDAKACMLVGPKGVGKTSALYYAYYSLPAGEFTPVMLKQPPANLTELAAEVGLRKADSLGQTLVYAVAGALGFRRPSREVSRSELTAFCRSSGRKYAVFVDEAHLAPDSGIYMEFKYLLDEVPGMRMVFSGLSRDGFPDSLMHLVGEGNVLARKGFSAEEMKRIVAHRIECVGGRGTHPFSPGALDEVLSDQNLLSPRYVFDELNQRLAEMAGGTRSLASESVRLGPGDSLVQAAAEAASHSRSAEKGVLPPIVVGGGRLTRVHADWWVALSPSQQSVFQFLLEHGEGATLNEICRIVGLQENTAFNALYQLRGDDKRELERKKDVPFPLVDVKPRMVGGRKKNLYYVAEKVRNLFTVS